MNDIVVAVVIMTGDGFFLLKCGDLPHATLNGVDSSWVIASLMLKEGTGLNNGDWALLKQVGFVDGDEVATVLYATSLPARTAPKHIDYKWVDLDYIISCRPSLQELIGIACLYLER
jgi:hypothetical protein